MYELNDLQWFAAVVALRSFSAAARQHGVPKSRVSRSVARLEERLGLRLLERSTTRLRLTEAGERVYEHARAAMAEAEQIEELASRLRSEPSGLVRVSCPLNLRSAFTETLPAFLSEHPQLRVQLIISNRRVDLIKEQIDIAIRVRESLDGSADVQLKRIRRACGVLVASPSLVAERGEPAKPSDLARFPLLAAQDELGMSTWTFVDRRGSTEVIRVQPRLATVDFEMLRAGARRGLGIAMVPLRGAESDLESGALIQVLEPWSIAEQLLHLAFTSRRGMSPAVRALIDFLADTLAAAKV